MRDGGRRGRRPLTASWSSLADWPECFLRIFSLKQRQPVVQLSPRPLAASPSPFGKIKRAKTSPRKLTAYYRMSRRSNSAAVVGSPSAIWKLSGMSVQRDAMSQPWAWPGLTRDPGLMLDCRRIAVKVTARICMTGVSSLPRGHSAPIASIENKSLQHDAFAAGQSDYTPLFLHLR